MNSAGNATSSSTATLCLAHGGDVSEPSGGTDRVTALAGGLAARGHDVSLVVPTPASSLPDRLADVDVVPVDPLPSAFGRAWSIAGEAARVAAARDATLQFEHSTLAGVATLRGCSDYVLDMHDLGYARFDHTGGPFAPVLKRVVHRLERRGVARAGRVVVVSAFMEELLTSEWGRTESSVEVVPNGYFPERIAAARDVETVPGRVTFLGTLHPKVDVDALAAVADLEAVTDLVIVGDGALREEVDRLADGHDAVRAPGRLPDEEAFELVASAAVVVNPQTRSALQRSSSPVKLYYYAALGRPMVVAAGPSVVSELAERDAAVAVDPDDSFVDAVADLLADDERRRRVGENAADAATTFTWDRRVDRFATLYEGNE